MANVATYVIQLLRIDLPADDIEEIKKKLNVPTIGYRDYTEVPYYRKAFRNYKGGLLMFNCRWGYDLRSLQEYLESSGGEQAIAWVIHCGEGPDCDMISSVTRQNISENYPAQYGFDEIKVSMHEDSTYHFDRSVKNNEVLSKVNFKKRGNELVIKEEGAFHYLTDSEFIDQCFSKEEYHYERYRIHEKYSLEIPGIRLSGDFSVFHELPITMIPSGGALHRFLKEIEYLYQKISFYWKGKEVFRLSSSESFSHYHQSVYQKFVEEQRGREQEARVVANYFCYESYFANCSFWNCANSQYLEWKKGFNIKGVN